jgi:beta-glucosidase
VAPASTLSFFWIIPIGLWDASALERDKKCDKGVREMGSVHVPRLGRRRRAGPRKGLIVLGVAVLAGVALVTGTTAQAATDAPYGGTPAAVPGTIQAANYDTGGQGVAYNVTSTNGTANSYRSDGVDLEACTDTGCGYDIGWTTAGQWFNYTVNVATAGTYSIALRLASPYGITDALHIANAAGTNLSGSVAVPDTGGYQDWATVTASVTLPAGTQTLRIDQDANGWNIHQLTFTLTSGGGGTGEAPYGGTPAAVPGTVQAANYDTGGQGVAYNVTSVNGSANSYRSDGVDLEACTDTGCGYDIGWTAAGQWFKYTVNVATAGTYAVSLRLAAPTAVTDGLHIANSSGTNLSGNVTVPATGGWQTWTTPAGTSTTCSSARPEAPAVRFPADSLPRSGAPASPVPARVPSSSISSTPPTARTRTARSTGASTASPSRSRSRRTTR